MLNGASSPSACPHLAKEEAASAILARRRTVYPGWEQHLCRDAAVTVTYLHRGLVPLHLPPHRFLSSALFHRIIRPRAKMAPSKTKYPH